jgi:hypothetical protein
MNTDELYNELAPDFASLPFSADAPSPAIFNNAMLLSVTNPERLLGLTPAQAIALAERNGACSGTLHALQIAANSSAGGWGEILRSPHCLCWFQWFTGMVDDVHPEMRAVGVMMRRAFLAVEAEECEAIGKLQEQRRHTKENAQTRREAAVHKAQRKLMDHFAGSHTMTLVQMYEELSRLSNKLNAAQDRERENLGKGADALMRSELDDLLVKDEKPAIREYLLSMHTAARCQRIMLDNANAFYQSDMDTRRKHTARRKLELQETLAQYLIVTSLQVSPLPDDSILLDRLSPDA